MSTQFLTLSLAFLMALAGFKSDNTSEKDNPLTLEEAKSVTTIVLNSNDQMKFDKEEIKVKAGQKVKLTLNHTGKLPKEAMGHNFVLLTAGTDIAAFATAAMKAKKNEYIPSDGVIAHTKLIGGGESTTIEFTVPKKGTYDFICSFPGHYGMMKGKFIVE